MARLHTRDPHLRRALRIGGFYMYDQRSHAPRIPARLPEPILGPWYEPSRANRVIALGTFLGLVALVVVAAVFPVPQTYTVATHTITADCLSASDMAHAFGWTGDIGEYRDQIEKLNGWRNWPTVQLGERVRVPDYRRKEMPR
jgi:hypothetical protein